MQLTRLLASSLLFLAGAASATDLGQFLSAGDDFRVSAQQVSAAPIDASRIVMWVGKVVDVSVSRKEGGPTVVEFLCEQHPFALAPKLPLADPLRLKAGPTGHFVLTMNLPTLSVAEAQEKVVKPLKSPAWVLIRGEPQFTGTRKGMKAVFLHARNATIASALQVELVK
jgi:hypothetical protein